MIAFIEGKVCDKQIGYLILLNQGIGYKLFYDPKYANRMPAIGEEARIYTYLNVREDEMSLYAFPDYEAKQLFELLITVSGIGPKMASGLVASISPADFALAILSSDIKQLTTVKGIGKKTAERMILELKDKIAKEVPQEEALVLAQKSQLSPASQDSISEARAALQVLGYSSGEADKAISQVIQESPQMELEVNEIIRKSLKYLAVI